MYYSICIIQSNIDPIKKLQNFYVWITFLPDLNANTNGLFFELKLLITGILEMQKVILMFDLRILIGKNTLKLNSSAYEKYKH